MIITRIFTLIESTYFTQISLVLLVFMCVCISTHFKSVVCFYNSHSVGCVRVC